MTEDGVRPVEMEKKGRIEVIFKLYGVASVG